MADRCADCVHLSTHDTDLPVCRLHRRFMHEDWTCKDFEDRHTPRDDGRPEDGKA